MDDTAELFTREVIADQEVRGEIDIEDTEEADKNNTELSKNN